MSPDGDKFNDPILQAAGLFDDDVAGLTPRDLQRRVVDRLYGTASDYYLAAEAAVELERSVLGLVQSGSEFVSGRYEEKSTPDDIYKQSSPLEQVGINIAIAGRNVKDAVVGIGELGMAILNDQRGPNNLTNRGIRQWNAALDAYEVLRDDPRAWSAAKSVVTEYIPSMPMAEQGGAITELVGTLGLGATTRVGTAAKGASLLEGFAAKAKEVVDLTRKLNEIKLQSPVVLELSASKLYSGLPLDGVRVRSPVVSADSKEPILFGQRRVSPSFSKDPNFPATSGKSIDQVVTELRDPTNPLSVDDLPITVFRDPASGQLISANTRTRAALAKAGIEPTKVDIIDIEALPKRQRASLLRRLTEQPVLENDTLPSTKVPVTPSTRDLNILEIIEIQNRAR
ncbi:MAG: hypothetical protein KZQ97_22085 [Candidatus Thiodiazotropha sp. (ex Dulcina madagascariensis)]|nr:hypothetical protein [Candidatus Thiodiazotropha sp. (ex Dulcina madagascariensis)]